MPAPFMRPVLDARRVPQRVVRWIELNSGVMDTESVLQMVLQRMQPVRARSVGGDVG